MSKSRVMITLAVVVGALAASAAPAQADPHPGQSVNVGIVDGTSVINGGSFPTTTSGPTGAFTDFTFTNVPVASVNATTLAGLDTVLLNVASPGMNCNVDTLSAGQKADLVNFLNGGGKLIIYDSECAPQDYSWLPHPFTTSNPGALGGTGTVNIVENNFLGSNNSADSHFIDQTLLGQNTDAVGDMNVLTTQDPNICLHMSGTNAAQQSGPTHVYFQSGAGLLIYNGFDVDAMNTGTSPDASTGSGNIAKVWLQELQQPRNGQGLACAVAVVGISLTPKEATNPVGSSHTVTATRTDQSGSPVPNSQVTFKVSGANAGASGTCSPANCQTDANGKVTFTYTGQKTGEDQIVGCFNDDTGAQVCSAAVKKTWTETGKLGKCRGRTATLVGTSKSETLKGTNGKDVIVGRGGNDKIKGLSGNDFLCGGRGNDKLVGGKGADTLIGGANRDTLIGGAGKDRLFGGTPGAPPQDAIDTCFGGGGADRKQNCEKGSG